MTSFLLSQWKNQPGGPQNSVPFMLYLGNETTNVREKELIVKTFDDWGVLTSTWFEVADFLSNIEKLSDDSSFSEYRRAALLSSKVAYCLGDYAGALKLVLGAEDLFSLSPRPAHPEYGQQDELYVNKIIEQAVDTYKIAKRDNTKIDQRLENLLNRIFNLNMESKEYRQVVGLALDTRRLDQIERAVIASEDATTLLSETVTKVLGSQLDRAFRGKVLDVLLRLFSELDEPDFVSMCQCLIKLEKPGDVAEILNRLVKNQDGELLAYQITFDLYENATQQFIQQIEKALIPETEKTAAATSESGTEHTTSNSAATETTSATTTSTSGTTSSTTATTTSAAATSKSADDSSGSTSSSSSESAETVSAPGTMSSEVRNKLRSILRGEEIIKHHMQFLIKNNHKDMLILKNIKDSVRMACTHNGTVIANGLMHIGSIIPSISKFWLFLLLFFVLCASTSAQSEFFSLNKDDCSEAVFKKDIDQLKEEVCGIKESVNMMTDVLIGINNTLSKMDKTLNKLNEMMEANDFVANYGNLILRILLFACAVPVILSIILISLQSDLKRTRRLCCIPHKW